MGGAIKHQGACVFLCTVIFYPHVLTSFYEVQNKATIKTEEQLEVLCDVLSYKSITYLKFYERELMKFLYKFIFWTGIYKTKHGNQSLNSST